MKELIFSAGIFLLNIPFGYWRAGTHRFRLSWFLAIHIPVICIILARLGFHIPYRITILPLNIAVFFLGQFSGGLIRNYRDNHKG